MVALVVADLPGDLDRLVPQRRRLEAALPAQRAGPDGAAVFGALLQPVGLPRRRAELPHQPDLPAPVPVLAVAVAAAGPAGGLLLEQRSATAARANCAAEILLLGTPVLWWAFIPALIGLTWFGISRRDWRARRDRRRRRRRHPAVVLLPARTTARCSTSTRCRPSRSWCSPWRTCSAASSPAPAWAGSAAGRYGSSLALPAGGPPPLRDHLRGRVRAARRGLLLDLLPASMWATRSRTTTGCARMLLGNRWI